MLLLFSNQVKQLLWPLQLPAGVDEVHVMEQPALDR